jgi:hypothetical protein
MFSITRRSLHQLESLASGLGVRSGKLNPLAIDIVTGDGIEVGTSAKQM